MVTTRDAVLVLSNSGETPEVADIVNYCHRFSIPLLAMVGKAGSALGEAANITLALPEITEAGPLGLAPTTSTTMMMALGDALAVALLDRRGFPRKNFTPFIPAANWGASWSRSAIFATPGRQFRWCQKTCPWHRSSW